MEKLTRVSKQRLCSALDAMLLLPVGVISTEVTYVLGGLVFAWIVEEWVWDYAITVTLLHIAMTVAGRHTLRRIRQAVSIFLKKKTQWRSLIPAVMSDFPSAEHWWIALGEP